MEEIRTHVDIDAPAAVVWSILANFPAYGRWNPLIRGVLGRAAEGRTIEIRTRHARGEKSTRPTIVRLRENRELQWIEQSRLPGLYAAERSFRIEMRSHGVRLHHSERASGLLAWTARRPRLSPAALEGMNRALKQRAEHGGQAPARAAEQSADDHRGQAAARRLPPGARAGPFPST